VLATLADREGMTVWGELHGAGAGGEVALVR
jgi:hypothetical protein